MALELTGFCLAPAAGHRSGSLIVLIVLTRAPLDPCSTVKMPRRDLLVSAKTSVSLFPSLVVSSLGCRSGWDWDWDWVWMGLDLDSG